MLPPRLYTILRPSGCTLTKRALTDIELFQTESRLDYNYLPILADYRLEQIILKGYAGKLAEIQREFHLMVYPINLHYLLVQLSI